MASEGLACKEIDETTFQVKGWGGFSFQLFSVFLNIRQVLFQPQRLRVAARANLSLFYAEPQPRDSKVHKQQI
jgi:hypothetical protein